VKRTKHANGREFQGRTWDGVPTSPQMSFALSS
jgi:protein gp37